jgi:predicted house-cleaning NTP pyrophosphatase (Maf/HAM1 superfamily)
MYSTTASFGLVGLQTDDTLIVADDTFAKAEEEELQKAGFMAKKREQLTEGNTLKFNGGNITLQSDNSITMTQESYNTTLQTVTKQQI